MKKWKDMSEGERAMCIVGIAFLSFLAVGVTMYLYAPPKNVVAQRQNADEQRKVQETADWMVNNLSVVKDPRKNLCIGYVVGGLVGDIKFMFYVPCELVPPQIIVTGKIVEKKQSN